MLCFRSASSLPEGHPLYNLSVTFGDTSPGRRGLGIPQTLLLGEGQFRSCFQGEQGPVLCAQVGPRGQQGWPGLPRAPLSGELASRSDD